MVPIPVVDSFYQLNAMLAVKCRKRGQVVLRGHTTCIDVRMLEDLVQFMVLPAVPFDSCHIITGRASSISLVRYRTNDYSVPTQYTHREVVTMRHTFKPAWTNCSIVGSLKLKSC
jgi:hypothetical protein